MSIPIHEEISGRRHQPPLVGWVEGPITDRGNAVSVRGKKGKIKLAVLLKLGDLDWRKLANGRDKELTEFVLTR